MNLKKALNAVAAVLPKNLLTRRAFASTAAALVMAGGGVAAAQAPGHWVKAMQVVSNNGFPTRVGVACYERPGMTVSMINNPAEGDTVVATDGNTRVVRLVNPQGDQVIGRMKGPSLDPSKSFFGTNQSGGLQALIYQAAPKAAHADEVCNVILAAFRNSNDINLAQRLPDMGQRVDPSLAARAGWIPLETGKTPLPNKASVFSVYEIKRLVTSRELQEVDAAGYRYAAGGTPVLGRAPDLPDQLPAIIVGEGRQPPAPAKILKTAPAVK